MDRNFLKCGYSVLKLKEGKRKIIDENEVLCLIAEGSQQLYCFLKAREFLKLRRGAAKDPFGLKYLHTYRSKVSEARFILFQKCFSS